MAKKKYSNKFDTVIEVADKNLLAEYLSGKVSVLDRTKELTQDYVHELLNRLKTEEERLDIVEEVECMEDLASDFFPQVREYVLDSDLKKTLKGYASEDIIEGLRGKGQYRISTHPRRVEEPSSNWLKKIYKHTVLPAVKAERKRRIGWGEN